MAKHIIYLGQVNNKYRLALFDSEDALARKMPVKDVDALPPNIEYLNCDTIDGKVVPNLGGVKILCVVDKKHYPNPDIEQARRQCNFELKGIWLNKRKEPTYQYGYTEWQVADRYGVSPNKKMPFYPGSLLSAGNAWKVWDEKCDENTFYVIADLAIRKSSKRHMVTDNYLCVNHKGDMFYTNTNDMRICLKAGKRFVQVGTPKLSYPAVYNGVNLRTGSLPLVALPDEDEKRIYWAGRKKFHGDEGLIEQVWWNNLWKMTVCDLRKYKSAKVFGINSIADASVIIFPESTEEIWLGLFARCSSVKIVYIPPSVDLLYDIGIPPIKVKKITIYSSSPAVKEFCDKYQVPRIDCTDADEMLKEFYQATDDDYLSVDDASNIATLAGGRSDKQGEGGTIWSAALFSLASTGIASEELRARYPITDTSNGRYKKPTENVFVIDKMDGECLPQSDLNKEIVRTFIGALTQFYPPTDKEILVDPNEVEYAAYTLGDHKLYIGFFAFKERPAGSVMDTSVKSNYGMGGVYHRSDKFKEVMGNLGECNHIALLESPRGEIIHRFACSYSIVRAIKSLSGAIFTEDLPSGVLRYADKLPTLSSWSYIKEKDEPKIRDSLFNTFLVFSYQTPRSKRTLVGIDLHTGALATAEYTAASRDVAIITLTARTHQYRPPHFYNGVNKLKNITLHPIDADISEFVPKDCLYNTKGKVID